MIKIKVPATSANFCIGFDCLGLAFDLYNEFSFEKSSIDKLNDFDLNYMNVDSNLVLNSYKQFFFNFNIDYIPVNITLLKKDIPTSRGLGSSAACIVAGVLAANEISNLNIKKEELFNLMVKIEGHPDNIAACFYGGFVASFKDADSYNAIKYEIANSLLFNAYIPNQTLSTNSARKVLPEKYTKEDVVWNLSRIVNLTYALSTCDFVLLKKILKDKIHEPYRISLIHGGIDLIKNLENNNCIGLISGSGSTILSISLKEVNVLDNDFKKIKLNVCKQGAIIYD